LMEFFVVFFLDEWVGVLWFGVLAFLLGVSVLEFD
jgi:hypothetical protein